MQILTNAKSPYNVSGPTASLAASALSPPGLKVMHDVVASLNYNRSTMIDQLRKINGVGRILGGNSANFVLAEILDKNGRPSNERATMVYKTMAESRGVVVRFRGMEKGCEGCLRITVGSSKECQTAVQILEELLQ